MDGRDSLPTNQAAGLPDNEVSEAAANHNVEADVSAAPDRTISDEAPKPAATEDNRPEVPVCSSPLAESPRPTATHLFNAPVVPINFRHSTPVIEHPYPRALARGRLGRTLGGSLHDSSMEDVQVLDTEGRLEREEEDKLWERYKDMESVDDGNPFTPDPSSGPPHAAPPFSSLPPSPGLVNYFPSDAATRNSHSENEGNNDGGAHPLDTPNFPEHPLAQDSPPSRPDDSRMSSTTAVNLPTSKSLQPSPRAAEAAEPPRQKPRYRPGCCFYLCLVLCFIIGILIFIYLVALIYMKSSVDISHVKLVAANSSIIATSAYALTLKAFVSFTLINESKWDLEITIEAVKGPISGNVNQLVVKHGEKKEVSMETIFAYNEGTDKGWNRLKTLMKFCNRIPSHGDGEKHLEPLDWTIRAAIVNGFIFPAFSRTFPLEGECPVAGDAKIDLIDAIKR